MTRDRWSAQNQGRKGVIIRKAEAGMRSLQQTKRTSRGKNDKGLNTLVQRN